MGMRKDIDDYTAMITEAKEVRDREGCVIPSADAQYQRRVVEGDFTGLIRGWQHPADAETWGTGLHRTRVEAPLTVGAPTRRGGGVVDPGGQQGAKPEIVARRDGGRMIGERPGPGGTGRYGARKQQITRDPSEKQQAWITSMLNELSGDARDRAITRLEEIKATTGGQLTGGWGGSASTAIDALKEITAQERSAACTATATRTRAPLPQVGDGRYAVPGADGTLKFYRVTNHRNGRVYVSVQASDAWHRVPFGAYAGILAVIAADPAAAGKRYADEIGDCWRCGRFLTDEESRARGMGPICAARG